MEELEKCIQGLDFIIADLRAAGGKVNPVEAISIMDGLRDAVNLLFKLEEIKIAFDAKNSLTD
ncbi:MAG: hypothetical protein EOM23_01760 [Candidatus Moranbacteria bacterium]|nr:hypothetical protein [Candidatus Moranbacteria bacterium]